MDLFTEVRSRLVIDEMLQFTNRSIELAYIVKAYKF